MGSIEYSSNLATPNKIVTNLPRVLDSQTIDSNALERKIKDENEREKADT